MTFSQKSLQCCTKHGSIELLGSGCAKTTKTFIEVDLHYLDDVRNKIILSDQLLQLFEYTLFYFFFRTAVPNDTPSVQEVVAHSATQMRSLATHDAAEELACKCLLPTPTKKQKIRAVVGRIPVQPLAKNARDIFGF
jgi:hypothetical protein